MKNEYWRWIPNICLLLWALVMAIGTLVLTK